MFVYKFRTLLRVLKSFGTIGVLSLIFAKISMFFNRGNSKVGSHEELVALKTFEPEALLEMLFEESIVVSSSLNLDYERYNQKFEERLNLGRNSFFDSIYDLGPKTRYLVFSIIRILKPFVVLETGVAAGASSNTFLAALRLNGTGLLESVDITSKVGELVDPIYREGWKVHVLSKFAKKYSFTRIVKSLGSCEIFIHDSNHAPKWQMFEFREVCEFVPSVKFLIFDDVTPELLDYVETHYPNFKIFVMRETRKFSALFVRG